MLGRLRAEIFQRKITYSQIAKVLNICPTTVGKKVNGITQFNIAEANKLRETFFSDLNLQELFSSSNSKLH